MRHLLIEITDERLRHNCTDRQIQVASKQQHPAVTVQRCNVQWRITPTQIIFKVTPLFDAEYLRNSKSYSYIQLQQNTNRDLDLHIYTCPTAGCHFKRPSVTSSDLAKYSTTWSIARGLSATAELLATIQDANDRRIENLVGHNSATDFSQILQRSRDETAHLENTRWRTAAILKNRYIAISQWNIIWFRQNLIHRSRFWLNVCYRLHLEDFARRQVLQAPIIATCSAPWHLF